jgi:hypothetical protein
MGKSERNTQKEACLKQYLRDVKKLVLD